MNDRPQIDPRYDPAFQRGFTGEVQTGQHPHGAVRATRQPATAGARRPRAHRGVPSRCPSSSVPPAYAVAAARAEPDAEPEDDAPSATRSTTTSPPPVR